MVMQDQGCILPTLTHVEITTVKTPSQLPDIESPRHIRESCVSLGDESTEKPRPFTLNVIDADSDFTPHIGRA